MAFNNQGAPFSGTMFLNKAVVTGVTGQAAKTFSATPAGSSSYMEWAIHGKAYSCAAISGGAVPTTDALTGAAFVPLAANQGCVVLLGKDAGGNTKAAQGPVQGLDAAGNFVNAPEFPFAGDSIAWFAYIVLKNGSTGSAWTFGTNNWNATGMTATPVDIVMVPGRPQVS